MSDDLLQCDARSESYKGACHLALGTLAAICAAYSGGALIVRPSRRLAWHTALYWALALYEARQTHRHWTAP